MSLLRLIRLAMPDNTTEIWMNSRTRTELRAERDALSPVHGATAAALVAWGELPPPHRDSLHGLPVFYDANVPPCTVKFITPGRRNYWFGWTA